MISTDTASGTHGYSMCSVPPGYNVPDYQPDSDTYDDLGG